MAGMLKALLVPFALWAVGCSAAALAPEPACGEGWDVYHGAQEFIDRCYQYCVPRGKCQAHVDRGHMHRLGVRAKGSCAAHGYPVPATFGDISSALKNYIQEKVSGPCTGIKLVGKFKTPASGPTARRPVKVHQPAESHPELPVDNQPAEDIHPELPVDDPPAKDIHPELPVDDTPAEVIHPELPVDDTPVDDTPEEDIHPELPVDDTPAKDIHPQPPVGDQPAEELPVDDQPAQDIHPFFPVDDQPAADPPAEWYLELPPANGGAGQAGPGAGPGAVQTGVTDFQGLPLGQ